MKRRILRILGVGVLLIVGVSGLLFGALAVESRGEKSKVTEFTDISQLKEAFNEDAGAVRMVVLVSPT